MSDESLIEESPTSSDWDNYWTGTRNSDAVYSAIADQYRKLVIRRSLMRAFSRHIPSGSMCLHAGAGSGEVDIALADKWNVVGLDFSWEALGRYRTIHSQSSLIVQADNFMLPFPNSQFECIFNLGVMEHFDSNQIYEMLIEFRRVLSPDGKLVLFWPPIYGLSVLALRTFHGLARKVKKDFSPLHPKEISLIRSRESVRDLLVRAGFCNISFKFELRDLFTHEVVVASVPRHNG